MELWRHMSGCARCGECRSPVGRVAGVRSPRGSYRCSVKITVPNFIIVLPKFTLFSFFFLSFFFNLFFLIFYLFSFIFLFFLIFFYFFSSSIKVYMALAVTNKEQLSKGDLIIILFSFTGISCGFLLNFNLMPVEMG